MLPSETLANRVVTRTQGGCDHSGPEGAGVGGSQSLDIVEGRANGSADGLD